MKNAALPLPPNATFHRTPPRPHSSAGSVAAGLVLLLQLAVLPPIAQAQLVADDFNDGNDNGWVHYDPIALAAGGGTFVHYSFPNGTYRIQADPSPLPAVVGPGRGASLRSESYTDFYIAVNIVGWDDSLVQAFGPLARVTNPGPGTTLGYAFTYQNKDHSISIAKITNEEGNDLSGTSKPVTLALDKTYRFVFIGKGAGLEGRVYQLPDTRNPIAVTTASDGTYPAGIGGLLVYNNPPPGTDGADATFDNFLASDVEPPVLSVNIGVFGDLEVTWPIETVGFQLQSASEVPSTNWVTIPSDFINTRPGSFVYSTTFDATMMFYRLLRP